MDLLFDLNADIGERRNLGYQHLDVLHDLKAKLMAWKADGCEREGLFVVRYLKLFAKSSAVAFATTLVFWKVLFSPFSMRMRS